ncbi:unnamed protein product [Heligmosomoides polygyrus]|uniref:LisH domain-containing protein n=1 Tax=Heligmosomoides polygyrus TaxID=6339 RepID=A0A3P7XV52_HELPZ|nr:unnamed protein product [Heligmosomoides polygyrus]
MDVENVTIVDGLIFGYLGRRQYHETLRALCSESPSLRDDRHRFQTGSDVFIQVNDQLHDKNLEEIVNAFAVVGRFDVTPELVDFGIRLRDLTNEFSTMTAVRGRSVSDNQMKLYGKRVFTKPQQPKSSLSSTRNAYSTPAPQTATVYCTSMDTSQVSYAVTTEANGQQRASAQQQYDYQYQPQMSSNNTPSYRASQITQPPLSCEQPLLVDYGVAVKDSQLVGSSAQCPRSNQEETDANAQARSTSFSSEIGAHKRKAAIPHRRDELVAHTAQSLIVPNGVLLDLDGDRLGSCGSQVSLLSNIDDTAMQCLDRLINGNLDEVFPFCDHNDDLPGYGANLENPYSTTQANDNAFDKQDGDQGTEPTNEETAPPSLDVGPLHSPPPAEQPRCRESRSLDEGEIVSEENLHATVGSNEVKNQKSSSAARTEARSSDDAEATSAHEPSPPPRSDSRRSSLDSERNKREEKRTAERLKEFNRNPPSRRTTKFADEAGTENAVNTPDATDFYDRSLWKTSTDRTEPPVIDAVMHEASNVPRVSPPSSATNRNSRERTRGFSSLFEEEQSAPSSREVSPHREKLNRKEEERRRREKEMERERQRDKERLKRQRRDRDRERESERSHRVTPERKTSDRRPHRAEDEEKPRERESREKERKREQAEERRVVDEGEKRKTEERARREMIKKKREEELEAKRQAEQQRRAEAMKRKEEEERKRRQEERERQEERRREEERQRLEERRKREEEKAQRRREEELRRQEELEMRLSDASDDEQETAKSCHGSGHDSAGTDEDNAPSEVARQTKEEEEAPSGRKDSRNHEQKSRQPVVEANKDAEVPGRQVPERDGLQESDVEKTQVQENEERKRRVSKDDSRPTRSIENRKPLPPPVPSRRREESRKAPVKPLEPGMMMSDPGVLDRINKEMDSLTSRNRPSSNRSPEESASTVKSSGSTRIPKRETPVDYNQILFSNPPVIKRTPPVTEKPKNYVISSGLPTENVNQMVYSKAHSSRLGMFLEKVSDKHKRLMDRESDRVLVSPLYDDVDRNDIRSPVGLPLPRQQPQKFAPQKRPLPATSLESYLGSPPQSSPDIRDGDSSSSRNLGKKCKLDLSKMPDIMDKLYGGK